MIFDYKEQNYSCYLADIHRY